MTPAFGRTSILVGCLLSAPLLRADDDAAERALKRFFEGHAVVVRLDMPASSGGIDVFPEREDPLDSSKLADHLRRDGAAVRDGDRITVTKVKVKDDLIEFQLGGGGFSTFRDGSSSVSVPTVEKSALEKDLEREIKDET